MTTDPSIQNEPSAIVAERRLLFVALVAGVVVGLCSWSAIEGVLRYYHSALNPGMKPVPTDEDARKIMNARVSSGSAAFGFMGGLFGLAFGLAGGAARRSIVAAVSSGVVGLLAGALGTGGAAWLILPIFYARLDPQSGDLVMPLLTHGAIWCAAGAAGGLAFGLGVGGRGRWLRTALGGLVGAGLATVAYELIGALGFPTLGTHLPLSNAPITRGLAQILVAIGTGIGSVSALTDSKKRSVSS